MGSYEMILPHFILWDYILALCRKDDPYSSVHLFTIKWQIRHGATWDDERVRERISLIINFSWSDSLQWRNHTITLNITPLQAHLQKPYVFLLNSNVIFSQLPKTGSYSRFTKLPHPRAVCIISISKRTVWRVHQYQKQRKKESNYTEKCRYQFDSITIYRVRPCSTGRNFLINSRSRQHPKHRRR